MTPSGNTPVIVLEIFNIFFGLGFFVLLIKLVFRGFYLRRRRIIWTVFWSMSCWLFVSFWLKTNREDQLAVAGVSGLIAVFLIYRAITTRKKRNPKNPNPKMYEKSDFAIKYGFSIRVPWKKKKKAAFVITNPFRGTLLIGSAGSGKSESVIEPVIHQAIKKNYSGILYDFKFPELTGKLQGAYNKLSPDIKHYVFNFDHLQYSHRVNPLDPKYIPNTSYAQEYAEAIISNLMPETIEKKDFWVRSSISLLAAAIWFLREEHPEFCTLPHAVNLLQINERDFTQVLSRNIEVKGMITSVVSAIENNATDQVAGVVATLQIALNKINTPDICWLLSGNDFDLNLNNPDDPKFLSIGTNPGLVDTYSPVISLIMTVALKQMNHQNKHHSIVILDEAPTLYIPKLELIPATGRSNKIALLYSAQDISQIVDNYGKTKADVIMSNLNNQIYMRSASKETARHVSELFGKEDTYIHGYSKNTGIGSSTGGMIGSQSDHSGEGDSYSMQERSTIKPQELLNFQEGDFVATTVESPVPFYRNRFQLHDNLAPPAELNEIHQKPDVKSNFLKIKQDIETIKNTSNSEYIVN